MTAINQCPCHSGAAFADCCEPLVSGRRAARTAEALMRSRYTAYVLRNVSYLLASWYPSTRPVTIDPATIPDWCGLQIVRTEKGTEEDTEGVVEFRATALSGERFCQLHEVSRFAQEAGLWFYTDGDLKVDAAPAERRVQRVGRNDACPCGSGKKYKKCCSP